MCSWIFFEQLFFCYSVTPRREKIFNCLLFCYTPPRNNDILFVLPHQLNLFQKKVFDVTLSIGNLCEMEKSQIRNYMTIFENLSKFLYFKVWEVSGLPYSFYQYYSVHKKNDYEIKDNWKEHFKKKCLMPDNIFELGYEF